MGWRAPVDGYCERLDATFWSEPLNAATNLAFLLAALVAGAYAARRGEFAGPVRALVAILAAIGLGSFLFHTLATRWAGLADVIPIGLFIVLYVFAAMRRLAGFSFWFALSVTGNYVAFAAVAPGLAEAVAGGSLNGSQSYLPPLATLLAVGTALAAHGHGGAGGALLGGAALFAVSLTLRTVDAAVCPAFPAGTHFAWHLLNAALLGWLVIVLVKYRLDAVPSRG